MFLKILDVSDRVPLTLGVFWASLPTPFSSSQSSLVNCASAFLLPLGVDGAFSEASKSSFVSCEVAFRLPPGVETPVSSASKSSFVNCESAFLLPPGAGEDAGADVDAGGANDKGGCWEDEEADVVEGCLMDEPNKFVGGAGFAGCLVGEGAEADEPKRGVLLGCKLDGAARLGGEGSLDVPLVFATEDWVACELNSKVVLDVGFLGTVEVAAENNEVVDFGFSVCGGSLENTGAGVINAWAANIFVGGGPLGVVVPFMNGAGFEGDSKVGRDGASFSLKLSPVDTNVEVEVAAALPLFWRWRLDGPGPDPSSSVPSSTAFLFALATSFKIWSRLVS